MENFVKSIHEKTPQTKMWIDSLLERYIDAAIADGYLGVTSSPTVTFYSVDDDIDAAEKRFTSLMKEYPEANEREILWKDTYNRASGFAKKLLPLYAESYWKGRFAIQADIFEYRNAERMIEQGREINALGDNFLIKIPTTCAGLRAAEQLFYEGKSFLNTCASSVAQFVASVEMQQSVLERLKAEGKSTDIYHGTALQLGLLDTCIKGSAAECGNVLSEDAKKLGAVAVAKKICRIKKERGYDTEFILSNFITDEHWRYFIGEDIMLTLPPRWDSALKSLPMEIVSMEGEDVPGEIIAELYEKSPVFRQAYDEDGFKIEDVESYAPFARTVNFFTETYEKAIRVVRSAAVPDLYKEETKY